MGTGGRRRRGDVNEGHAGRCLVGASTVQVRSRVPTVARRQRRHTSVRQPELWQSLARIQLKGPEGRDFGGIRVEDGSQRLHRRTIQLERVIELFTHYSHFNYYYSRLLA